MPKILVLGGSGLVGKAIYGELKKNNNYEVYSTYFKNPLNAVGSLKLDIEDMKSFMNMLDSVKPDIIVSCLRGDFEKQLLLHTRAAEYLKSNNGLMYFCSTTNVFDNDLSHPHFEDDSPNSQTAYGQYKAECEKMITGILGDNAIILRLPQVWGKSCPRLESLLKALNNNEKITVYPELYFNTTTDVKIARKIAYIIEHNMIGIFHLVSEDIITYKDFYCTLINALCFNRDQISENFEEKGYFALLSNRSGEFPEELTHTNESVILDIIA